MAMQTRCCWPPESWCGYRRRNSRSVGSLTSVSVSRDAVTDLLRRSPISPVRLDHLDELGARSSSAGLRAAAGSCGTYEIVLPACRAELATADLPRMSCAGDAHGAGRDPRSALGVAEKRERDRRLARSRTRRRVRRPRRARPRSATSSTISWPPGCSSTRRPETSSAGHRAPPCRSTPGDRPGDALGDEVGRRSRTDRDAQRPARRSAHGWIVRMFRFSLIIRPQSAFGGWMPKPRKLIAAISAIDQVRRRPYSTISGVVTFGRISRDEDPAPGQTDQLGRLDVLPVDDVGGDAAGHTRDLRHPRERDQHHDEPELGAEERNEEEHEDDLREREDDVHAAHQHVVRDGRGCTRRAARSPRRPRRRASRRRRPSRPRSALPRAPVRARRGRGSRCREGTSRTVPGREGRPRRRGRGARRTARSSASRTTKPRRPSPNAGPPVPQRAAQRPQSLRRPRPAPRTSTDRLRGRAHARRVRSRGTSRTVSRSATRLTTT